MALEVSKHSVLAPAGKTMLAVIAYRAGFNGWTGTTISFSPNSQSPACRRSDEAAAARPVQSARRFPGADQDIAVETGLPVNNINTVDKQRPPPTGMLAEGLRQELFPHVQN